MSNDSAVSLFVDCHDGKRARNASREGRVIYEYTYVKKAETYSRVILSLLSSEFSVTKKSASCGLKRNNAIESITGFFASPGLLFGATF